MSIAHENSVLIKKCQVIRCLNMVGIIVETNIFLKEVELLMFLLLEKIKKLLNK